MKFYLAKCLQAVAIVDVGYAVLAGIAGAATMAEEVGFAVFGLSLFYFGRWIENAASRGH